MDMSLFGAEFQSHIGVDACTKVVIPICSIVWPI